MKSLLFRIWFFLVLYSGWEIQTPVSGCEREPFFIKTDQLHTARLALHLHPLLHHHLREDAGSGIQETEISRASAQTTTTQMASQQTSHTQKVAAAGPAGADVAVLAALMGAAAAGVMAAAVAQHSRVDIATSMIGLLGTTAPTSTRAEEDHLGGAVDVGLLRGEG
jgi:hypothetical protein